MRSVTRYYIKVTGIAAGLFCLVATASAQQRNTISLNGNWQIAEGKKDVIPLSFDHLVQVPGLVSLATPAFKDVGPRVKDRNDNTSQRDTLREAFWYRRTFSVKGDIPAIAVLKVAKAMFGTKVFLNGKAIGEHLPNFTPGFFDVKGILKSGENELIIRVGSCRDAVPLSIPNGFDYEKERYIPGIFDNVELTLSGTPNIIRVQAIPNIISKTVKAQVNIGNWGGLTSSTIKVVVREAKTGAIAGTLQTTVKLPKDATSTTFYVEVPVKNCRLWSPEDPFLYTLSISTEGDDFQAEFGMREFHFDPDTHTAVLNGKPYFMRGSNVTLYRFFEDSTCKNLPWNNDWVHKLHKSFKKFHWNSLRYCIGMPPDDWYRIADEEGFLIQNEFPVWYGGIGWNKWPEELQTAELVNEYTEFIQEYWNHPSVAIWDASNETVSNNGKDDITGEAVWQVRNLDLSNRPWDNSYSTHRAQGDVFESHPYHFYSPTFKLKDVATQNLVPAGNQYDNRENFPVIINEYGWLWLNRDGTPTTLTKDLYKNLLGENSTTQQRRHVYAMYTAAETEYWRCHRKAAAVLHFTALGYSRGDGQTSDNFIDPAKLEYESEFLKYMPDAFAPVGIMLDEWGNNIKPGTAHNFKITAINDLEQGWSGLVHLQIMDGNKVLTDKQIALSISPYGKKDISITCNVPVKTGTYTIQAVLDKKGDAPVKSIREIPIQ